MRKSRFTDEQIIDFLKQAEGGVAVKELCRKNGFSDVTRIRDQRFPRPVGRPLRLKALAIRSSVQMLARARTASMI